jgi:hypothetical protein
MTYKKFKDAWKGCSFSCRAWNVLVDNGYLTPDTIPTEYEKLLSFRRCGHKTVKEIISQASKKGITFYRTRVLKYREAVK